ncbi:hypothetical protein DXA46_20890 [Bacteroides sp. OF02-3LB]|nr:hypothetical protein DWY71_17530 [Bacteroides sp. AF26-7BH]RGY30470.1 hypothetical protein DXA46_20890 [Bacteroides sp. OF02-3LB]
MCRKNVQRNGLFGTLMKIAEVSHINEKLPLLCNRYNLVLFRQFAFTAKLPLLPASKVFSYPVCEHRFQ